MNTKPNFNNLLPLAVSAIYEIDNKINGKIRCGDRSVVLTCLELDIQKFYVDKRRIDELKKILAGVDPNHYPLEMCAELMVFIKRYNPEAWDNRLSTA